MALTTREHDHMVISMSMAGSVRQPWPDLFEAQALGGLHRHLHQLLLLLGGQDAGAVAARLIEVGLYSGPVVCDGPVHGLPLAEHQIHVHLWPIQILLQHQCQLDPAVCIALQTTITSPPHVHLPSLYIVLLPPTGRISDRASDSLMLYPSLKGSVWKGNFYRSWGSWTWTHRLLLLLQTVVCCGMLLSQSHMIRPKSIQQVTADCSSSNSTWCMSSYLRCGGDPPPHTQSKELHRSALLEQMAGLGTAVRLATGQRAAQPKTVLP